jgi:hypothetical protein
MAIQKAEQLAELIYSEVHNTMGPRSAADLIRADRRAVIEEYQNRLLEKSFWSGDEEGTLVSTSDVYDIFDSFLRELD